MKRLIYILVFAVLILACSKDPIDSFDRNESAVYFNAASNTFSLIGKDDDYVELSIPVKLIGPAVGYDRPISLLVKDSTAVQDKDYTIVKSQVDSGALSGNIVIKVKKLENDVEELYTKFTIVPNEFFPNRYYIKNTSIIGWTASYSRPEIGVWRYWYLYFCPGYSKNFHKLMIREFGTDIERYTNRRSYVTENPELIYKLPTWWYSATRQFRDMVKEHDAAHPDEPYMHSDDYQSYKSYEIPYGEGQRPEKIPTILETLVVL